MADYYRFSSSERIRLVFDSVCLYAVLLLTFVLIEASLEST